MEPSKESWRNWLQEGFDHVGAWQESICYAAAGLIRAVRSLPSAMTVIRGGRPRGNQRM